MFILMGGWLKKRGLRYTKRIFGFARSISLVLVFDMEGKGQGCMMVVLSIWGLMVGVETCW